MSSSNGLNNQLQAEDDLALTREEYYRLRSGQPPVISKRLGKGSVGESEPGAGKAAEAATRPWSDE